MRGSFGAPLLLDTGRGLVAPCWFLSLAVEVKPPIDTHRPLTEGPIFATLGPPFVTYLLFYALDSHLGPLFGSHPTSLGSLIETGCEKTRAETRVIETGTPFTGVTSHMGDDTG